MHTRALGYSIRNFSLNSEGENMALKELNMANKQQKPSQTPRAYLCGRYLP